MIDNEIEELAQIFNSEEGLSRALSFANNEILVSNLMGRRKYFSVGDLTQSDFKEYPTIRTEKWYNDAKRSGIDYKAGKGEMPMKLKDDERISHRSMKAHSMINIKLWDEAGWSGTGFWYALGLSEMPALILAFKKSEYGVKIFQEWVNELGRIDLEDKLSITIVRGVNKKFPNDYRVLISEKINFSQSGQDSTRYFTNVFRILEMKSSNRLHFDTFIEIFKSQGKYKLVPGQINEKGEIQAPEKSAGSRKSKPILPSIVKSELKLIDAWKIGRHDFEVVGIRANDDIYIPDDVVDVPVLEVIKWKKEDRSQIVE